MKERQKFSRRAFLLGGLALTASVVAGREKSPTTARKRSLSSPPGAIDYQTEANFSGGQIPEEQTPIVTGNYPDEQIIIPVQPSEIPEPVEEKPEKPKIEKPVWTETTLRIPLSRVSTTQPLVGLTIDDGNFVVEEMVGELIKNEVRATLFITGANLKRNPDIVRMAIDEGFEFGNHTYNHLDLRNLSAPQITREISLTEETLKQIDAGASTLPYLRPPGGATNGLVGETAARLGFRQILWNVSGDAGPKVGQDLLDWYLKSLIDPMGQKARGSIILLHFRATTLAVISILITELKKRDLQPVPLSELFASS